MPHACSTSDAARTLSPVAPATTSVGELSAPSAGGAAAGSWAPIVALSLGIAALVGSEFLPASVLPAMAKDLGVSEGTAGLAVAVTAIAGAATAPTIAVLLPRADRRVILVWLLAGAALSDLVVAVAPGFAVLLLARLMLGIAIAGYWSFAFSAGTFAVRGRDHVVSTSLSLGVSLATIIGVPVASVAGDAIGWRAVFLMASGVSLVALAAVATWLPAVPAHPAAGLTMMRQALTHRRLMAGVGCVVLVAFANFAAYPYIRIAIAEVAPDSTGWLLLAWGVGGLAGNVTAGALSGRLRFVAAAAPLLLGGGLVVTAAASSVPVLVLGVVIWGFGFNMVPVATQLWVTRVESERAESAMSLQVTAFQVAITLGAAVGGLIVDEYEVGTALLVGAGFAVASGVGFGLLRVPRR